MVEGMRDPRELAAGISDWIAARVEEAGMSGVVFGLSGGIDSAVVCGLARRALGEEHCLGLIMPIGNIVEDAELARETADVFGIQALEVELAPTFDALTNALDRSSTAVVAQRYRQGAKALALANLKPRLRMAALYYHANMLDALVIGTGNRAELTVGYFTKHGDGGSDILPLGGLLKHEVREVARVLGVPERVIERPPSAGLWAGQTDEDELGFTYEQLDRYLSEGSSGSAEIDTEIRILERGSAHKRSTPPIPDL